jgi:hypothetical protein
LVGLVILAAGSVGRATVLRHTPKRPATVVLHPKWHAVAPSGGVLVSGRYVYIGAATGSAVLIDEQTGKRVTLAPPTRCYFDGNAPALGGSWVVATCNPPPPGPRYLYELYSIANATWTPFTPDVKQMFAFNADCRTGDPQCSASYTAIGSQWIEFRITCGYHCGPTTFAFQNIQSGQIDDQPAEWRPGGTEVPDLSSPTLTRTLCKPLEVPAGFTDPSTQQTLPGTISFYGRFAVAQVWSPGNLNLDTYLELCGSRLRKSIDPNGWPLAANRHAVVWTTNGISSKVDGLFLPSLRRLVFRAPSQEVSGVVFSTSRLYVESQGRVWSTTRPRLPQNPRR